MDNLIYVVLFLILVAEFVDGWTDAPNAVATVISTRTLSPLTAVLMATLFNLLGVFAGTAVATTIGTEIINANVVNMTTIASSMIAVIIWCSLAAFFGLPTSETHALVSGLGGAGIATAGFNVLVWAGWKKVLMGLVFSTFLGFIGGLILMTLIYHLCKNCAPAKMRTSFSKLQIISSALVAFAHGSNDGQKFMGIFALTLVLAHKIPHFMIPTWVIFLCAFVMATGTLVGGRRIIKTMGFRITNLETPQGFSAEMATGTTLAIASFLGVPLSTTHTINTAIMGVGATRRFSAVRWGVTANIVAAWVLTFPICGLIGYAVALLLS